MVSKLSVFKMSLDDDFDFDMNMDDLNIDNDDLNMDDLDLVRR